MHNRVFICNGKNKEECKALFCDECTMTTNPNYALPEQEIKEDDWPVEIFPYLVEET